MPISINTGTVFNLVNVLRKMSARHFEGQDHAKYYAKYRPIPPASLATRLVEFLKEKYEGSLDLAVDLGCGNGQCTFVLADKFSSVLGTDISPAQISEAVECSNKVKAENVKFQISPAEEIPVSDNSVQLITICTAAHWMDLPKVYEEARRVLVKNGVFAIAGYHLPLYIPEENDAPKADAINQVVEETLLAFKSYWPEEADACLHEYPGLTLPFSDFTRENGYNHVTTANISDILGSIRSYSPYQNFCRAKSFSDGDNILENLSSRITTILNEGRDKPLTAVQLEEYEFSQVVNYFVLMARH